MISEDLDEVMTLSDRIAVMYEGAIVGEVDAAAATVEELGLLMAGVATSRPAARRERAVILPESGSRSGCSSAAG